MVLIRLCRCALTWTFAVCIFPGDFFTTLRKHAYSNILKFSPPKTENFQIKNSDIFHISAQNIDCRYSSEQPPHEAVLASTHNLCF